MVTIERAWIMAGYGRVDHMLDDGGLATLDLQSRRGRSERLARASGGGSRRAPVALVSGSRCSP